MGLDLLILALVALSIGLGAARGWRQSVVDLASLVGGLLIALVAWPVGHWLFHRVIGLPDLFAGPLGVGLMAALAVVGIGLLGARWVDREEEPSRRSRVGGGAAGLVLALIGLGPFLLVASLILRNSDQVDRSLLGRHLLAALPLMYEMAELPGLPVPKIVAVPTEFGGERARELRWPTFRPMNFRRLEGAQCIKCGGSLDFLGYRRKDGPLPIPKFECEQCGRTSDGCQGHESFHEMYHACPVDIAREGAQLDCGVWTNGEMVWPRGECPACGKRFIEAEATTW